MIKISNLVKDYKNRSVLKHLNYTFPNKGLFIICGPSGCGKTTLLNCLAGLISFEGSIEVNNVRLETLSDNEISLFRLKKYGFVFQDFKLFENETVMSNLLFPLETLYRLSKDKKTRKCQDLLTLVGLINKENHIVNKLSGGEKQRIAIARALINDPQVILADEPTGSLDEKSSQEIMNILKIVAKKSLVIVVSHDVELTKKYADYIVEMIEGKIDKVYSQVVYEDDKHLPIIKNGVINKRIHIPDSFLLKHTYHNLKQKKARTAICYSMTSLGLIGVGLAFALSSTISENIKEAYREIVDEDSLVFSLKEKDETNVGQFACSYYQIQDIKEKYKEYVKDVGINYYVNFEKFFPDANSLVIVRPNRRSVLPNFSVRYVNDFVWLDDIDTEIYPEKNDSLDDDQIILGLNYQSLMDMCFELQIERNLKTLSNYIKHNDLYVYFDLRNNDWQYDDEQLLQVVGFTLENEIKIYHSNHFWNEYMFEERMRFPVTDSMNSSLSEPWIMRKIYYLKTDDKRDKLLNLLYEDKLSEQFIFEIANETYYPWLYYEKEMSKRDRILVFNNSSKNIPLWHIPYILENDSNLKEPIIANSGGYLIYPESLMMGFAKTMYFSKSKDQLEEIIDYQTSNSNNGFYQEDFPSGVLSGNYAKSLQNGINFCVFDGKLIKGSPPNSLNEIVLSYSLFKELGLSDLEEMVYVATSKKEVIVGNNQILNDYVIIPIKVVGISLSNKNYIYHNNLWTTLFFQCEVGISAFNLQCTNMCFSLNNVNKIDDSIAKAEKAFPQYKVINPLKDVNESIDEVCFYVTIVLIIFSSIATIISVLLLTICNYIYILEAKKEIALSRCLGINKKESSKFLLYHSLMQCLISFSIASFELFFISIVANLEISSALSLGFSFTFNPISLIPMLVLAISIGVLSSAIMSSRINKINAIDALKT